MKKLKSALTFVDKEHRIENVNYSESRKERKLQLNLTLIPVGMGVIYLILKLVSLLFD